jgi:hypothetical protein
MIQKQVEAERQMSREQRAASRDEQSLAVQAARFFQHFGLCLGAMGFGRFGYNYL